MRLALTLTNTKLAEFLISSFKMYNVNSSKETTTLSQKEAPTLHVLSILLEIQYMYIIYALMFCQIITTIIFVFSRYNERLLISFSHKSSSKFVD